MTIAGWDFEQPTEAGLLDELTDAIGDPHGARMLLDITCRQLRLERPLTSPGDIILATECLLEMGDLLRVAARSTKIRAVTYRALATKASS
ncbi:hypothetical protein [Actinoplanes couchii]|uniref:Uncharacterized protein n=1 Tax=Actinoplanes couchii TaxID=403638 RepID=A0ABQ3XPS5_9ACTN|nr:hypothetical protein [Actinoplanes couchii]MDR6319148.1 hypothetical protein [Actinoplanes couchii]GID60488.1 hypothetical protein Aco03nite_088920 [Actinoplanes couchii]